MSRLCGFTVRRIDYFRTYIGTVVSIYSLIRLDLVSVQQRDEKT